MNYKFILSLLLFGSFQLHAEDWTWFFSKRFKKVESYKNKDHLTFVMHTPKYSQLILSWNAFRPAQGHFRFWVQAQDSVTKKWYDQHHIIDWGKDLQHSYISVDEKGTGCYHVRLEMPKNRHADAFRVKIESHDGADLSLLKGLNVCVSDLAKFKMDSAAQASNLKSAIIEGVPMQSQMILDHPRANHLCSPTSLSMLLGYFTKNPVDPLSCAEKVYDSGLDSFGSWPFNVAHAFEACKGKISFGVTRLASFADIHKQLVRNLPVMVSVRGELKGAAKPYNDGHLLLIVGYDAQQKKIVCHDPAFEQSENVLVSYDIDNFLYAWGRSRNLAYIAEPVL